MHETIWPQGQELLAVEWQKFPENTFLEPVITKIKQEGIKSSQPEASKKAYTPPHLRMIREGKDPDKFLPKPQSTIPGLPPGNLRQFWQRKYDLDKPLVRPGSWREQQRSDNDVPTSRVHGDVLRNYLNRGQRRFKPYKQQQKRHYF